MKRSVEEKAKYGCAYCADKRKCKPTEKCRYADILDKYASYGVYERTVEELWREIIGRQSLGSWKPQIERIVCVETGVVYNNCVEAARMLSRPEGSIWNVLDKPNKTYCGYHWVREKSFHKIS